jgi:sporulation protein YlmC with PRC-barrel domain
MTRLSNLIGKNVQTESGNYLGRANEVRASGGVVTAVICGPLGFLQRLFPTRRGRWVPWSRVRHITSSAIICDD